MSSALEQLAGHARQELAKTIVGQRDALDLLLLTIVCGGHALIEGVPGLAKTLAVRTLARILQLQFQRVQCTPDLMPADIIGANIFNMSDEPVRVAQGAGVHRSAARGRDQPHAAADAGGASRGDGGAPGHDRRRRAISSRPASPRSPRRIRSSSRARIRCRKRSSTGSSSRSRLGYPDSASARTRRFSNVTITGSTRARSTAWISTPLVAASCSTRHSARSRPSASRPPLLRLHRVGRPAHPRLAGPDARRQPARRGALDAARQGVRGDGGTRLPAARRCEDGRGAGVPPSARPEAGGGSRRSDRRSGDRRRPRLRRSSPMTTRPPGARTQAAHAAPGGRLAFASDAARAAAPRRGLVWFVPSLIDRRALAGHGRLGRADSRARRGGAFTVAVARTAAGHADVGHVR